MTVPSDRKEAAALTEALQRIQGIADADGGLFLGEYGFTTIKDGLYEARRAAAALLVAERERDTLREALKEQNAVTGLIPSVWAVYQASVSPEGEAP